MRPDVFYTADIINEEIAGRHGHRATRVHNTHTQTPGWWSPGGSRKLIGNTVGVDGTERVPSGAPGHAQLNSFQFKWKFECPRARARAAAMVRPGNAFRVDAFCVLSAVRGEFSLVAHQWRTQEMELQTE